MSEKTGNEYTVDYHDLDTASEDVSKVRSALEEQRAAVATSVSNICKDDVFSGPVADVCKEALDLLNKQITFSLENFDAMVNYFDEVSKAYQEGNDKADKLILSKGEDGKFTTQMSGGLVGDSNEEKIFNYFKAKGLTDAEACGIMACIFHESRFLPDADRNVPGDESYGICQWLAERRTALEDYCRDNGKEVSDLEAQLDFIFFECETTQKRAALSNLKAITGETADAAAASADRWLIDYEGIGRSRKTYAAHSKMRQDKARELFQRYHKQ